MKCTRQQNSNLIVIWLLFPFFLFFIRFLLVIIVEYSHTPANIIHNTLNEWNAPVRDDESGDGGFEGQKGSSTNFIHLFCCFIFSKPLVFLIYIYIYDRPLFCILIFKLREYRAVAGWRYRVCLYLWLFVLTRLTGPYTVYILRSAVFIFLFVSIQEIINNMCLSILNNE